MADRLNFGCVPDGMVRDVEAMLAAVTGDFDFRQYALAELADLAPHLDANDWMRLLGMARLSALISGTAPVDGVEAPADAPTMAANTQDGRADAFEPMAEAMRCRVLLGRALSTDEFSMVRQQATVNCETAQQLLSVMSEASVPPDGQGDSPNFRKGDHP